MQHWPSYLALSFALIGSIWSPLFGGQSHPLPELSRLTYESYPPAARLMIQRAYDAFVAAPQDAAANGDLGKVLHAHLALEESEICYRRAHLLDPTSFRWTYYLGLVQAAKGEYEEAVATLQEALRLDPEYLPAQMNLGRYLLAVAKWEEAAQVFEEFLTKHPDSAEALYGLGRVRAVHKDSEGAVEAFLKASEIFPSYGAVHYALAQTYKRLGKMDQALERLALYERNRTSAPDVEDHLLDEIRGLTMDPSDQLRLAVELERRGKLVEAVAACERALQLDSQLIVAQVTLIALSAQLGQISRAEEHFQAAARIDPNEPASYFNHGLLLASQGEYTKAEREFRKTLTLNPDYPGALTNLGNVLEAQGKSEDAAAEFRKAIERRPDDFRAHFGLGRVLVNQQRYEEGIQHLLKCLGTPDEDSGPAYVYALGAAYVRSGDLKNGLRFLRLAREKALTRSQTRLVESLDRDLQALEAEDGRQ